MAGLLDDDSGTSWGGLLGGPRDSLMAPIIGNQAMGDARMNALLNFGAGLMQAGGWSKMPVTLGQALGSGLEKAQGAYAGSLDNSLKGAMTAQQLRMQQFNMARQMALLQAAQQYLGGGATPGAGNVPGSPANGPAPVGSSVPNGAPASAMPSPSGLPAGGAAPSASLPQPPAPAAAAAASAGTSPRRFDANAATGFSLLDPEHAAAYKDVYEMQNPQLVALPDGTVVNMRDPSLQGTNHAALPPGMIRLPDGTVANAPGFAASQYQLDANKAAAEHSQDLVNVTVPGKGTFPVPRSMLNPTLAIGPNGQPQLQLGAGGGFGNVMTTEDPASLAERKGDVDSFIAAKKDAMTKAQAATDSLAQLNNLDTLIHQVKPQYGDTAAYEVGRVLDSAGLLKGDASQWVANAKAYQQAQRTQVLSSLKSTFPGRISNMEMNAASAAMGNIDDPMQAVLYANDVKRVQQRRLQDYSDFLQNYDGPRGKFEQAWRNSEDGQKSLYDYPEMWKHLPVLKGKQGTPAAGQTFVKTPNGTIYPVQLDQYGEPEPVSGAQ